MKLIHTHSANFYLIALNPETIHLYIRYVIHLYNKMSIRGCKKLYQMNLMTNKENYSY